MSISKVEKSITSGDENSVSQTFFRNKCVNINAEPTSVFNFEVPQFLIGGATYNYYSQATDFISTNLNNIKTLTYYYTANTCSLSGTTKAYYDIYKLDYNTYITAKNNIESGSGTTSDMDSVQSLLNSPLYTMTGMTSAITMTAYTITIPAEIKPPGAYKTKLFDDKCQYFVNTYYEFDKPVDLTLGEKYSANTETGLYDIIPYSSASTVSVKSETNTHIVTASTFSGVALKGVFFVYFTAPNKPNIDVLDGQPAVTGVLNTYSPIFAFNGTSDGDFYKLQVSYDITNENFTGTNLTNFEIQRQDGDDEYIRTYSIALTPNTSFIYRIGNTKYLENIFQVRHSVTSWSHFAQAQTVSDGNFNLSGNVYYHYINSGSTLAGASISIEVLSTFSNVDLEADTRTDATISGSTSRGIDSLIGTVYTTTTDANGYFVFSGITGGNYKITASDPSWGFLDEEFNVILTENTSVNVIFDVLWGNTIKTFGDFGHLTFL